MTRSMSIRVLSVLLVVLTLLSLSVTIGQSSVRGQVTDLGGSSATIVLTSGPPAQLTTTWVDTGSGLASIVVTRSENADTVVPPFTPGTTQPVVVTSTLIDQSQVGGVTFIVTDVAGNQSTFDLQFDGTSLIGIGHGTWTVTNDPNQAGAIVNYPAPSASGAVGTVTCTPPSGSFFLIGQSTVTCQTATGLSATLRINVLDLQQPTVATLPDVTVTATSPAGAIVTYPDPTASDNAPGVTVSCSPPSGSTFPAGTTTVTCTATDVSGNTATSTFDVTVIGSDDLLGQLRSATIDFVTNAMTEQAMVATLDQVRASAEAGNAWGAYVGMLKYNIQLNLAVATRAVSPGHARELATLAQQALYAILWRT